MQTHLLTLGDIPYLVEFYKSSEMPIKHVEEYVMLRNYEIINDIAIDKEITFIPTDDYSQIISDNYEQADGQAFLCSQNGNSFFSSSILDLCNDSSLKTLRYYRGDIESDIKFDYYELFSKEANGKFARLKAKCDMVRIYKPHERKLSSFIISMSNYINNIHFNYFCKLNSSLEVKVGKEKRHKNSSYYEYVEFYVPDIEELFGSCNVYYNEDLNIHQSTSGFSSSILNASSPKVMLRELILPYTIDKLCTNDCSTCKVEDCKIMQIKNTYAKTFLSKDIKSIEYANSEYNFSNIPFVMTLTQYDEIDSTTRHYLSTQGISPSSLPFTSNNQFYIKSKISFDENNKFIISVINEWSYPTLNNTNGIQMSLRDAYFYCNKITNIDDYEDFSGYDDDIFLANFSEELIESLSFASCGCIIEMALDNMFKNIFYRRSAAMDDGIDDFSFNLNNIFSNWKEYPEVIFVRTMFIDKFLSKVFFSNIMALTKEKFKYCINDTERHNYRISLQEMKNFNFIDKINCIVNRHELMKENVTINGKSGNSQIVYKTVFYKTQDAQRIKIRQTVVQNIGINLGEYMTKVENFKLAIEGYEFTESARNDAYVIFKIPGSFIATSGGRYDIMNADDDTYITSGEYQLI